MQKRTHHQPTFHHPAREVFLVRLHENLHEDLRIELDGCDGDFNLKAFIKTMAEDLQQQAPSDAFIKIRLEKSSLGARGWMRICSLAGNFAAEARGLTPVDVARRLVRDMKREILSWKRRRSIYGDAL